MRFLTVLLAFSSAAAAQPQASEVLTHVRDVYTHLQAIHVTAVRTDEILMPGNPGSAQSEYELAEKAQGKIRAWMRAGDREGLAVSDGATTWKALPKAKQWMKLDVADIGSDAEDAPGTPPPSDLQHLVAHHLLSRYATLAKIFEDPELVREESVNLKSGKTPCWVLRGHWKNTKYELWVDEKRYLVLRDTQSGLQQSTAGEVKTNITTKVTQIAINGDVDDSLFTFTPERRWTQVETLVLPEEKSLSLTGLRAPDFALKSLNGEQLHLSNYRGKVVVIDFWATWCGPCRQELPSVNKLSTEFADNVQFLTVNNEDAGKVRGFLQKNNYGLEVLMDGKKDVQRQYGVNAIPTTLIVDRDGVVRQHYVGSRTEAELRKAIESTLALK